MYRAVFLNFGNFKVYARQLPEFPNQGEVGQLSWLAMEMLGSNVVVS